MKHTAEARLDATVETGAGAKVNAKGAAHFDLLGPEATDDPEDFVQPALVWPAMSRRSSVPKRRRR